MKNPNSDYQFVRAYLLSFNPDYALDEVSSAVVGFPALKHFARRKTQ